MTRMTTRALSPVGRSREEPKTISQIIRDSDWVTRIVAVVGLLIVWQLASIVMGPLLMPSPQRTLESFIGLVETGELLHVWMETFYVLGVGLAGIAIIGISLGIFLGRYRIADTFVDPVVTGLFMLPKLALLPIVALWLGYQDPAKIVYIFLFGFFEVLFTVRAGVRAMQAEFVEVARAYVVPERKLMTSIILPASLPFVVTGLRLGLLRGIEGAVIAGFLLESNGIGGLIFNAGMSFRPELLFAGLATVAAVGIGINVVLHAAERRIAPWSARKPI
jgi:sulfonate transport system permease protein